MCDFTGIFIYHIKAVQLLHAATQMAAQHHPCIRLSGAGALGSSPCTWPEIIASICLHVYENQYA